MGAEFNYYRYTGDKSEMSHYHEDTQIYERQQYGSDTYSGHLGILPCGLEVSSVKEFSNVNDAREYLQANHSKSESALAVPYMGNKDTHDASSKDLIRRKKKLFNEIKDFSAKKLKEIKAAKSKTIGCKPCGSSVSRKFLRGIDCPVCGEREVFYTTTNKKVLALKKQKYIDLERRPLKSKAKKGVCYLIGGWCPS